jgi:uncharacterized protein (TIGR03067 family)
MKGRILLVAGLGLLACSCGSKLKTELEGTWNSTSADLGAFTKKGPGQGMRKDAAKDMKKAAAKGMKKGMKGISKEALANVQMIFRENHFLMTSEGEKWSEGWFSVNDSASPKHIEILHGNKVTTGIFKIEKDELTICLGLGGDGGQAPTDFSTPPPAGCILLVLKRESR